MSQHFVAPDELDEAIGWRDTRIKSLEAENARLAQDFNFECERRQKLSKRLAHLEAAIEEAHSAHCNCHTETGKRMTSACPEECEMAWRDVGGHPHPFIDPCCLSWREKVRKG